MTKIEQIKTAAKRTIAHGPKPVTVHSAESELNSAYSDYSRAQLRLLDAVGAVGWKRIAAAFIASFCVGYGIGWLAGMAIEAIAVATFALTASATASVVVWLLGLVVIIAAAMYASRIVGMAVYDGSAERFITTTYTAARGWVASIFDRKELSHA